MADSSFMLQAKCATMVPSLFDGDHPANPKILCAGCPVMAECARWHMEPINMSEYVVRFSGYCPDEVDDVVWPSGVKAAGMIL